MKIEYLPTLKTMREVYELPRTMERFQEYLRVATGGTDDIAMPILSFNPMAKEDAIAKLDALLAMGAEDIAAEAAAEAEQRLVSLDWELKAGLEMADDIGGAWSQRYTSDAARRMPPKVDFRRPFVTGVVYVSEPPTEAAIRQEMLSALYRAVYLREVGLPKTLGDLLRQEGLAGRFAGAAPSLSGDELTTARERIAPYLGSDRYPEIFASFYGDEAAESVGYPRLSLPSWAGLTVAIADAMEDPVAALRRSRTVVGDKAIR
jgi:hypothetical protein